MAIKKKKTSKKKKGKWMTSAFAKNKGALHKALGVPPDETIPPAKLAKAKKSSNPKMRKRANLAMVGKKAAKK